MLLNLQLIKEGEKPSIQMAGSISKKTREVRLQSFY